MTFRHHSPSEWHMWFLLWHYAAVLFVQPLVCGAMHNRESDSNACAAAARAGARERRVRALGAEQRLVIACVWEGSSYN